LQILWTKGASDNLDEVEAYIGQDNPRAAIETVLKVINSVNQLAKYPAIGRPGRIEGTRELVILVVPLNKPVPEGINRGGSSGVVAKTDISRQMPFNG